MDTDYFLASNFATSNLWQSLSLILLAKKKKVIIIIKFINLIYFSLAFLEAGESKFSFQGFTEQVVSLQKLKML